MPEAIFAFSPGGCAKFCPCTRCTGGTPRRITVTLWKPMSVLLAGPFDLWHDNDSNQVENCVWKKVINQTIGCGVAVLIQLSISEAGGTKKWLLQVQDSTGASLYEFNEDMINQGDCVSGQTLLFNLGSCTADNPVTADLGMPDGANNSECCACSETGSGGSATECGHCTAGTTPPQIQLTFTGIANLSPTPSCASCGSLNGTYLLDQVAPCRWELDISTVCGHTQVMFDLHGGAFGGYRGAVFRYTGWTYYGEQHYLGIGSEASCNFVNEIILLGSDATWPRRCDHSAGVCTVNSIY